VSRFADGLAVLQLRKAEHGFLNVTVKAVDFQTRAANAFSLLTTRWGQRVDIGLSPEPQVAEQQSSRIE